MNLRIGVWRINIEKSLPQKAELAEIYDRSRWFWNSFFHRLIYARAYRRLFKRMLKDWYLVNLQNGSKVLDVGIGAGLFTESLVKAIPHDYEIFGIDISPKLLETARQNLLSFGVKFHLERGDSEHLPFAEAEMDLVVSALVLEHAPDPAAAIREMTRVLRPGANLIIVVTLPYAPDFVTRLFYQYTPLSQKQIGKWMKDAGLTNVTSYNLSGAARILARAFVGKKC